MNVFDSFRRASQFCLFLNLLLAVPVSAIAAAPKLPINATFPSSDPNMIGITDAYASVIADELLFCGARSQHWASTINQAINFDLQRGGPSQTHEFMTLTNGGRPPQMDTIEQCRILVYHPVHAALIASMNAFVIQADNN